MATVEIGIIGSGNVGSALERGLKRRGDEVRIVGRDKATIRAPASWAGAPDLAARVRQLLKEKEIASADNPERSLVK